MFLLLTLTAVPFWALMVASHGFYGMHSPDLEPGVRLVIKPFRTWSLETFGLAGILETKDELDLNSRLSLPRDQSISRDLLLVGARQPRMLACSARRTAERHPRAAQHLGGSRPCVVNLRKQSEVRSSQAEPGVLFTNEHTQQSCNCVCPQALCRSR